MKCLSHNIIRFWFMVLLLCASSTEIDGEMAKMKGEIVAFVTILMQVKGNILSIINIQSVN